MEQKVFGETNTPPTKMYSHVDNGIKIVCTQPETPEVDHTSNERVINFPCGFVTSLLFLSCILGAMQFNWRSPLFVEEEPNFVSQLPGVLTQQNVFIDPLDNLLATFKNSAVETETDGTCLACFFNDTGRIRRANVPSATESFVIYRSEPGVSQFEVITHVFHNRRILSPFAGLNPFRFAQNPFAFLVADDADGDAEPDSWRPVPVSYQQIDNRLGWEKGIFTAEPEEPDTAKFLKIMLNVVNDSWRPQLGEVQFKTSKSAQSLRDILEPMPAIGIILEDSSDMQKLDEGAILIADTSDDKEENVADVQLISQSAFSPFQRMQPALPRVLSQILEPESAGRFSVPVLDAQNGNSEGSASSS